MKRLLPLIVTLIAAAGHAAAPEPLSLVPTRASELVYVCHGSSAYAYHSHYCRGLKKCRSEVTTTTRERAEASGRTPCGICYRTTRLLCTTALLPHIYNYG